MERCAVKKGFLLILTILLILGCAGCGSAIRTPDAVDGSRIGVLDGSSSERYAVLHGTVKTYATPDELWGSRTPARSGPSGRGIWGCAG